MKKSAKYIILIFVIMLAAFYSSFKFFIDTDTTTDNDSIPLINNGYGTNTDIEEEEGEEDAENTEDVEDVEEEEDTEDVEEVEDTEDAEEVEDIEEDTEEDAENVENAEEVEEVEEAEDTEDVEDTEEAENIEEVEEVEYVEDTEEIEDAEEVEYAEEVEEAESVEDAEEDNFIYIEIRCGAMLFSQWNSRVWDPLTHSYGEAEGYWDENNFINGNNEITVINYSGVSFNVNFIAENNNDINGVNINLFTENVDSGENAEDMFLPEYCGESEPPQVSAYLRLSGELPEKEPEKEPENTDGEYIVIGKVLVVISPAE